jgi:hypothetical protein
MRIAAAIFLISALVTTACDRGAGGSTPVAASCTNEATATAVIADEETAVAASTPPRIPRIFRADAEWECRLKRGLMTEQDFGGPGWRVYESGRDTVSGLDPNAEAACGVPLPERSQGVAALFTGDPEPASRQLVHSVIDVGETHARLLFDALRFSCGGPQSELAKIIPFEQFGDETIAIEDPRPFFDVRILIRTGGLVSAYTSASVDRAVVEEVMARSYHRLSAIGPLDDREPPDVADCETLASNDALSQALVGIQDLGPGWLNDPPADCPTLADTSRCFAGYQGVASERRTRLITQRTATFQVVARFDGDGANRMLDDLRAATATASECSEGTQQDYKTYSFYPMPDPYFGDESVAWVTANAGAWNYQVAIRRDELLTVITMAYHEPSRIDPLRALRTIAADDDLQTALRVADERLHELADD